MLYYKKELMIWRRDMKNIGRIGLVMPEITDPLDYCDNADGDL